VVPRSAPATRHVRQRGESTDEPPAPAQGHASAANCPAAGALGVALLASACVLIALPMAAVHVAPQRRFIAGMLGGAVNE
jgi:ABC-type glycerol-3-phosphate transport system permease component